MNPTDTIKYVHVHQTCDMLVGVNDIKHVSSSIINENDEYIYGRHTIPVTYQLYFDQSLKNQNSFSNYLFENLVYNKFFRLS